MKKGLTELVFILDESGSMSGLVSDTIGGFNSLIEKQKKVEGEALVTTVLFNNRSSVLHDRVPLEKVEPLTANEYVPCGGTALLDAFGKAIDHVGNIHKYAREEDVPELTIFAITTDGMENSSREYTKERIKEMVEQRQEKDGWQFIFYGANIDAFTTAESYGIDKGCAYCYTADSVGLSSAYKNIGDSIQALRIKPRKKPDGPKKNKTK